MNRFRELTTDITSATGAALFLLSLFLVLLIIVSVPVGHPYSFFGFLLLNAIGIAGGVLFVFGVILNRKTRPSDRLMQEQEQEESTGHWTSMRGKTREQEAEARRRARGRFGFLKPHKPRWVREWASIDFSDRRQRRRLFFFMAAGVIEVLLLSVGGFRLAIYAESSEFCGELCHSVMHPEYITYQESPHAHVDCAACHVGPGATWLVKSKVSGLPQIVATILNNYERPILSPVQNLRPARDTCEQCHWPRKFSGDLVRVNKHYLQDETNTEVVNSMLFKVGGGDYEVARDIHWHIGADVWYLPLDRSRQEIGWVGVEEDVGTLTEYVDPERTDEFDAQTIEKEKRLMDCVDCHNRATHIFYSPDELIDQAIAQGKIDRSLPFIKREALNALDPVNPTMEKAISKIEAIDRFYENNYPQVHTDKQESINRAIDELKRIADLTTFPDMDVTWETHPNNLGHQESPGCMRCHGKLISETDGEGIVDTCSACHTPLPIR